MSKVISYDVFEARRERQRQEETHHHSRQQVIDYWARKGFVLVRFADGEALEQQCSEACYVLLTGRDGYEVPATLQAEVSVSFYMPDGWMACSCDAGNSAEAFVAITRMDDGAWLKG